MKVFLLLRAPVAAEWVGIRIRFEAPRRFEKMEMAGERKCEREKKKKESTRRRKKNKHTHLSKPNTARSPHSNYPTHTSPTPCPSQTSQLQTPGSVTKSPKTQVSINLVLLSSSPPFLLEPVSPFRPWKPRMPWRKSHGCDPSTRRPFFRMKMTSRMDYRWPNARTQDNSSNTPIHYSHFPFLRI